MTPARHTKSFSYYSFNYFRHVAMLEKFAGFLVGPLFVGAPVRPNMQNMPKSASACIKRQNTEGVKFLHRFSRTSSATTSTVTGGGRWCVAGLG